jgi:hypothetical protein
MTGSAGPWHAPFSMTSDYSAIPWDEFHPSTLL